MTTLEIGKDFLSLSLTDGTGHLGNREIVKCFEEQEKSKTIESSKILSEKTCALLELMWSASSSP